VLRRHTPVSESREAVRVTQPQWDVLRPPTQQGMVVHAYNPSIWETEAGRLRVEGQPVLPGEILSQKSKHTNKKSTSTP
jgi:hypothetical protein